MSSPLPRRLRFIGVVCAAIAGDDVVVDGDRDRFLRAAEPFVAVVVVAAADCVGGVGVDNNDTAAEAVPLGVAGGRSLTPSLLV